jgi:hypothetical protein
MRHPAVPIVFAALITVGAPAASHPGGLNSEGCHNDRKNGGYHCHRAGAPTRSQPPAGYQPAAPRQSFSPGGTSPGRAYTNCTKARAAGAAPVWRGDPGYGAHLDRDNDGVGCE